MGGLVSNILFGNQQAEYQSQQIEAQRAMQQEQQSQQARQQRGLLERQQAAARAAMAGRGVGSGSGSGANLLAGMSKRTEQAIADNAKLASMRDDMLVNELDNNRQQSVVRNLQQGLNLADNVYQFGMSLFR